MQRPPYWPPEVEFIQAPDLSGLSAHERRTLARSGAITGVQVLVSRQCKQCNESAGCLSCGRVVATRDWPAFEVIGELCGRITALPPQTSPPIPLEPGDIDFHIAVDSRHGQQEDGQACGDTSEDVVWARLRISTGDNGATNELAFLRAASAVSQHEIDYNLSGNVAIVTTHLRGLPALLVVSLQAISEGQELLLRQAGLADAGEGTRDHAYCLAPHRRPTCRSRDERIRETATDDGREEGRGSEGSVKISAKWAVVPQHRLGAKQRRFKTCLQFGTCIRPVITKSHPACGQNSLWATQAWLPGQVLGEYCGRVASGVHSGDYVACLVGHQGDSGSGMRGLLVATTMLGIDAAVAGNQMRMINDFRGISSAPNCAFSRVWLRGMPALVVVVIAPVPAGQEFLLDYGPLYWERVQALHDQRPLPQPSVVVQATQTSDDPDLKELEQDLLQMTMQSCE